MPNCTLREFSKYLASRLPLSAGSSCEPLGASLPPGGLAAPAADIDLLCLLCLLSRDESRQRLSYRFSTCRRSCLDAAPCRSSMQMPHFCLQLGVEYERTAMGAVGGLARLRHGCAPAKGSPVVFQGVCRVRQRRRQLHPQCAHVRAGERIGVHNVECPGERERVHHTPYCKSLTSAFLNVEAHVAVFVCKV